MRLYEIYGIQIEGKSSDKLTALANADQNERDEYLNYVNSKHNGNFERGAKAWAALKNRKSDNVFNERTRVDQYIKNFLQKQSVLAKAYNKSDWNNFFLIAQHADHNVPFQELALKYLKKYGTVSNQKYLTDRILRNKHKNQTHGTQNLPWRSRINK